MSSFSSSFSFSRPHPLLELQAELELPDFELQDESQVRILLNGGHLSLGTTDLLLRATFSCLDLLPNKRRFFPSAECTAPAH